MRVRICMLLLAMLGAGSSQAAEIDFASATDFIRMELLLKDSDRPDSNDVALAVTLSQPATERFKKISRESMGQPLTLSINGRPITTAIVHSVLGAQFRVSMSRSIAKDLLPTLLE
jgi:hypothetical protein